MILSISSRGAWIRLSWARNISWSDIALAEGESDTGGNTDRNGNGLSKVVEEWLELNTGSFESGDF